METTLPKRVDQDAHLDRSGWQEGADSQLHVMLPRDDEEGEGGERRGEIKQRHSGRSQGYQLATICAELVLLCCIFTSFVSHRLHIDERGSICKFPVQSKTRWGHSIALVFADRHRARTRVQSANELQPYRA